jgi:hypothetical protein
MLGFFDLTSLALFAQRSVVQTAIEIVNSTINSITKARFGKLQPPT